MKRAEHIAVMWAIAAVVNAGAWAQQPGPAAGHPEKSRVAETSGSREDRVLGPGPADHTNPPASVTGSRGWLLQTLSALGVVLFLVLIIRILLQRASTGQSGTSGGRLVELLARSPIGFKTYIVFLRINRRVIVASQTPHAIETLAVLDAPEDLAWVLEQAASARSGFGQVLKRFDRQHDAADAAAAPVSEAQRIRRRLSELGKTDPASSEGGEP